MGEGVDRTEDTSILSSSSSSINNKKENNSSRCSSRSWSSKQQQQQQQQQVASFLLRQWSGLKLKHMEQTHGIMITGGVLVPLLAQFISACSSLGFSGYALSVFTAATNNNSINGLKVNPNTTALPHSFSVSWYNNMIKALSSSPSTAKQAISLFKSILLSGFRPDSYSFPLTLKAVVRLSSLRTGTQLHCQSIRIGLHSQLHVVTALIQMYSSCVPGSISDARKLFDGMYSSGDLALWNAMVAGYVKRADLDTARDLFERMPQRNVISWTSVISGYVHLNRPYAAIALFRRMQLQNVKPDEIAMLAALSACAQLGALELGEWIHNYIDAHGLDKILPLNNALIDMYAKSGNITKALQVFESTKHKNVITWTAVVAGLALHGLGKEATEMFSRMERAGVTPNDVTFLAVLSACSHSGLVQIGKFYFNIMRSRYAVRPKIEHYGCMIDLLGRAGYLQEAQELLSCMPFEANAAIWGSLLAASTTHGNAQLGDFALHHLVQLEPDNSGNFSLLSNIYASLGRWNDSRMVRKVMRDLGVKKMPGISFTEVNNRVYEFIAGEVSHPQFAKIHEVLYKLNGQLRLIQNLEEDFVVLLDYNG